ncbi:hypothetical protein HU200_007704 [Digitaria exilis]|uniref:Copper transport protein n=1 Tax=Digitaria exilis TaxID=1010633 RepID=A0A835KQX5_9POAL|nr:hypothetical protein HU200_007704 [Digitaria exilis]
MGTMAPAPGGAHVGGGGGGMGMRRKRYIHMTFFWGSKSEILFTGWPGAMYAAALVAVFAVAFLLEFLGSRRLDSLLPAAAAAAAAAGRGDRRRVAAGASRAAVRVGGSYLLMLALMSFNGGVLLVAVAGHAAGFLAFKAGFFGDGRAKVEADSAACC